MQSRFSTFQHHSLLIFTIFVCMVMLSQSVYARKIVKDRIKVEESKVYLIEENDVLAISVFEEPDLSLSLKVAGNGTIAFPLIREIEVKGLTTYEIEQKLEKHLKDGEFLINPRVSVKLDIALMKEYSEKEIFVMGAVVNSGSLTILGKYITVLEAVAMAGGFKKVAAPNRTTVTRMEEGKEKTMIVDLNKVKKGDMSLDILLKTGDIVNVPESYF
jgi:protein involved in polysaccharide export with SLBB domain